MVDAGISGQRVLACGGVTKNPVWMQINADVLGRDSHLTEKSSDAGILGCGLIAAQGYGIYGSLEEAAGTMVKTKDVIFANESLKELYDKSLNFTGRCIIL
jgi:sugar (pentulose or hexulose) kinase